MHPTPHLVVTIPFVQSWTSCWLDNLCNHFHSESLSRTQTDFYRSHFETHTYKSRNFTFDGLSLTGPALHMQRLAPKESAQSTFKRHRTFGTTFLHITQESRVENKPVVLLLLLMAHALHMIRLNLNKCIFSTHFGFLSVPIFHWVGTLIDFIEMKGNTS